MTVVTPTFPAIVWDGLSDNKQRASRQDSINPNSEDWDRIVAELIATQDVLLRTPVIQTGAVSESVTAGQPLVFDGFALKLAQADSIANAQVVGLALGDASVQVVFLPKGQLRLNDWTNVVGHTALEPYATYFLNASQAGTLTTTPPDQPGEVVVAVGRAVSEDTLDVSLDLSVEL